MKTMEVAKIERQPDNVAPREDLILEDEFLTVDRLVPVREDAANRSMYQILAEIDELMRNSPMRMK